jgi:hypothetical protein
MKHERRSASDGLGRLIDRLSAFLAARKGLLLLLAILLVLANAGLQFFPSGWLGASNLLLHLGVIVGLIGVMVAWAL